MTKRRVDTLLVDRGLADTPAKAQALVLAGQVRAGERPISKPGFLVEEALPLVVAEGPRYVSRGGEKLDHALTAFALDVSGFACADVGASTGGFTDCLLQHGAERVYAVDVGKGQLDYRLRTDPRVVVVEGANVRHLTELPEMVDLVTVDVSFISLRLVLPVVRKWFEDERRGEACLAPTPRTRRAAADRVNPCPTPGVGTIVALFKPQFEARKSEVPRGGVIVDPAMHSTLIGRFTAWCTQNGFRVLDLTASPILGAEGNREFLFWLRPSVETACRGVSTPSEGGIPS